MNDNLLIAAVLREFANALRWSQTKSVNYDNPADAVTRLLVDRLRYRAEILDPPEKNEQTARVADFSHVSGTVHYKVPK